MEPVTKQICINSASLLSLRSPRALVPLPHHNKTTQHILTQLSSGLNANQLTQTSFQDLHFTTTHNQTLGKQVKNKQTQSHPQQQFTLGLTQAPHILLSSIR